MYGSRQYSGCGSIEVWQKLDPGSPYIAWIRTYGRWQNLSKHSHTSTALTGWLHGSGVVPFNKNPSPIICSSDLSFFFITILPIQEGGLVLNMENYKSAKATNSISYSAVCLWACFNPFPPHQFMATAFSVFYPLLPRPIKFFHQHNHMWACFLRIVFFLLVLFNVPYNVLKMEWKNHCVLDLIFT